MTCAVELSRPCHGTFIRFPARAGMIENGRKRLHNRVAGLMRNWTGQNSWSLIPACVYRFWLRALLRRSSFDDEKSVRQELRQAILPANWECLSYAAELRDL